MHDGLPALPGGTALHRPNAAGRLQASHEPLQVVSQQMPSTQWALVHSFDAPQVAPSAFFGWQAPAPQKKPLAHWLSAAQVPGQLAAAPLHR
jgi:hypothetical protein